MASRTPGVRVGAVPAVGGGPASLIRRGHGAWAQSPRRWLGFLAALCTLLACAYGTDLADADADGLPDAWELQIVNADDDDAIETIDDVLPGADFDGDGGSNAEEAFWKTDPCVPDSKLALDWADAVAKLRTIGLALARYQEDHGVDALPPRLLTLVSDGYLERGTLVCRADPTAGAEGGIPDAWTWHPAAGDAEEAGVSFFYEFSEAPWPWWGPAGSTWYSMKLLQLQSGNGGQPYDPRAFPVVRCFWLEYPKYLTSARVAQGVPASTLNLAYSCLSVFASEQEWERQSEGLPPDAPPQLRDLVTPGPVPTVGRGETLEFPLWVKVRDVDEVGFALADEGDTGRKPSRGGKAALSGCAFRLTPDESTPPVLPVALTVWQGGTECLRSGFCVYVRGAGVVHVNARAAGANDGTSWADAYADLQVALDMAAATATAEAPLQVWVAAGTYRPASWPSGGSGEREKHFALGRNTTVYGGFPATGNPALAERRPAAFPTVLSGDIGVPGEAADDCYHVIYNAKAVQPGAAPVLDGVTICGGNANATAEPHDRGGGVYASAVGMALVGCVVSGNAAVYGGGICDGAGVRLQNCILVGNTAAYGGALYCRYSSPALTNCTVVGNSASGGAVYGNGSPAPTVTNCVFWGNGDEVAGVALGGFTHNLIDLADVSAFPISNLNQDPLFTEATRPAGLDGVWGTGDDGLRPGTGSPCIDAGDTGAVPTELTTDIAGAPRVQGSGVDLGAYEAMAKADQTIAFDALAAKTYGDGPFALSATATSGLPVSFASSAPTVASVADGTVAIHGAGTATLTASQAGDGDWNPAPPVTQTLTVAKATLTATARDAFRPYGAADPPFTLSCTGFVNGDDEADLDTAPTATCGAGPTSPPGTYAIVPAGGADTSYDFAYVNGTLTIAPLFAVLFLAGEGGSISGTTPQAVAQGDDAAPVTAVAAEGYHFVRWTLDGTPYSTADSLTIVDVQTDMVLTAVFERNRYTVRFEAGDGGEIDGPHTQTVPYGGTSDPVAATAWFGYVFAGWSDGVTTATRAAVNVTADQTLTASFAPAGPDSPAGPFLAVTDRAAVLAGRGLWDLTGVYATAAAGHPLVLHLTHDTKGKLTGQATYTVAKDTVVDIPIKGSAKGTAGSIVVKVTLKHATPDKSVSVALTLSLTVHAAASQLTGSMLGTVALDGVKTAVSDPALRLPIPAPMDGTWRLRFDLAPTGTAVSGTARLVLANGVGHDCVVKGKTAATAVEVSLAGAPADPLAKGIKLKATVTPLAGGWARLNAFSGKGYGQSVAW